ncbi:uncharacterized protein K02A2.6-like [Macrosteles quadrilineatus]|uniref:uncharacterized protein K02A2.6-like n=1 Tax=Macrosteles quadrilineatus TaxID=74068 RepID=UPI0023E26433|nr:uncharacterized protein K02A2.6-like [Macrosteles quadrilineatus]
MSSKGRKKRNTRRQRYEDNEEDAQSEFNYMSERDSRKTEDLHGLAKTCAWGELNDEMVLLVLIIGMKDEALSDRLQLDSQLTLEKAINTLRQHEELERQKRELANTNVFMVNQTSIQVGKTNLSERAGEQKFTEDAMRKKCRKCGYNWHGSLAECPARKAKCDKCSEIGHFFRCCPSREKWMRKNKNAVKEIEQQDSDSGYQQVPEIFIGNIDSSDKAWVQEVKASCGNQDLGLIKFKLDTAADVTMIPVGVLGDFIKTLPLGKCKSPVFSAKKKERINILGTLRLKLEHKGVSVYDLAYISEEITGPLLSRRSCEELNLVRRIFSVDSHDIDWATKYPNLFQGLGNMKGEYKIEMKENAVPYAISTPRVVPIPLKTKVKEQLDDMLEKGVIVPVEHATDWCAPMVVCAKKGGGVRICVDLSKLNNSVKRRFYPIPKIELSLAEIAGAKYFSKIDANSGFWQLNLAEESQDYTTFITPFGRYKFRKLPFGITSAPEEFQRRMSKALEEAKNCLVHIDDCLIWGRTKEEHDECLRAVLERVQANGITLNKQKSEFCKKTVTFLGFVLSKDGIKPDPSKVQAIVDLPAPRNANEVQRFMGMITFLAKFIPNRRKDLAIADLLSRSPIPADEDGELTEEVEAFVHEISLISINTTDENVTKEWGFSTFRSSPHHHQGNGAAEAAVKVAKGLMKKNKDKFELALLSYRTSPLETGFSPSELMFGRKLRDNLPSTLVGNPVENKNFLERENKYQNKYKIQFDKRHGASGLSELEVGSMVWITDLRRHGKVVRKLNEPRSYLVETDKRTIRRNRKFLVPAPYYGGDGILSNCSSMVLNRPCNSRDRPGAGTVTRYGRSIKKPRRY